MMQLRLTLTATALFLFALPAEAQIDDEQPLSRQVTQGKRVRKRGTVKQLRRHKVRIGGRKTATVEQITKDLFKDHRGLGDEMRRSRGALTEAAKTSDEVIETDDEVVITTKTTFTVKDPDALRRSSKRFGRFRGKKTRGGWKLSKLKAQGRKDFNAFKARAKKFKAGHPLRAAAEAGDDALVDALLAGKGDFTVEETIIIPKKAMKRDASGALLVPRSKAGGGFDFKSVTKARSTRTRSMVGAASEKEEDVKTPPSTSTSGKTSYNAKFLTGFTKEDNFVWQKKWKFPSGHFIVKFKAWYEFGLRVPLEVRGTLEPRKIIHKGPNDVAKDFTVTLSAKTKNADSSYFRETGLASSLVNDGKEFLLGAGFALIVKLKAGFVIKKTWTIPNNAEFDFSQNFKPPFGDCGTRCGFDVWIPSSVTGTELNLLGLVKGSARIGFNVSGNGEASVAFEALAGNDTIKSWPNGKQNQSKRKHTVTFKNANQTHKLRASAPKNPRVGTTKEFGYRLSTPKFTWKVKMTPGVRADIRVKAKPFVNDNFPIGPFWLDSMAINLGTLKLGQHKGTKTKYKLKHGEKTWKENKAGGGARRRR